MDHDQLLFEGPLVGAGQQEQALQAGAAERDGLPPDVVRGTGELGATPAPHKPPLLRQNGLCCCVVWAVLEPRLAGAC